MREGMIQGREQGLAHERALLQRMAASSLGEDTAERLGKVLTGMADPERLAEVGEWLVLRNFTSVAYCFDRNLK